MFGKITLEHGVSIVIGLRYTILFQLLCVLSSDFILFKGKLQKNHAVIRDIFSVNSDKKNHDPDR